MAKLTLKTSLSFETQARLFNTVGKDALVNLGYTHSDQLLAKKLVDKTKSPLKSKQKSTFESASRSTSMSGKQAARKADLKDYIKEVKTIQDWMHKKWPAMFDRANPKPLKRHIDQDILPFAAERYKMKQIRKALYAYTTRTDYMKALITQDWRYDLNNQPVEEISVSQKDFTQVKMAAKDKQAKQRIALLKAKKQKAAYKRVDVKKSKLHNKVNTRLKFDIKINAHKRHLLVKCAEEEGQRANRGNDFNAGPAIEKYLAPLRQILSMDDPTYLNLDKGFNWCAAFVFYLVDQCGFNVPIMPLSDSKGTMGLVGIWYQWAIKNNRFYTKKQLLVPGDIVLFDKLLSPSELDHMGIVIKVLPTVIITAEGNINRSTGIFNRRYDQRLRGFIRL